MLKEKRLKSLFLFIFTRELAQLFLKIPMNLRRNKTVMAFNFRSTFPF